MKFAVTPVTQLEQEAKERQAKYAVWPKGVYDFEIISSTEGLSKAGNSMITVELRVFNSEGRYRDLKDYLVDSVPGKIHGLCKSIGIEKKYLSGSLDAHDLQGCAGKCRLGIESDEWNGERRQKNKIAGYVEVDTAAPTGTLDRTARSRTAPSSVEPDLDDSIPF